MNETQVTLSGYVGGDVTLRRAGDVEVASFRLALTPRRHNRRSEEWYDAPTQWWTVNAWRLLGRHCAQSLQRGDAVVVHGRVDARTWTTSAGVETTTFEIDASFVGHDLNRGTTAFTRSAVRAGAAPVGEYTTDPEASGSEAVPASPEVAPDSEAAA